jgi:hypothetical protein
MGKYRKRAKEPLELEVPSEIMFISFLDKVGNVIPCHRLQLLQRNHGEPNTCSGITSSVTQDQAESSDYMGSLTLGFGVAFSRILPIYPLRLGYVFPVFLSGPALWKSFHTPSCCVFLAVPR